MKRLWDRLMRQLHIRRYRATPASGLALRPFDKDDVANVLSLWAEYAAERFGEVLSYDRWGPGVPVPYDGEVDETPTQSVDPRLSVREYLERTVEHPDAFGFLAEIDNQAVGFVTASLRTASPVSPAREGWIEELYVRPQARRRGIGTRLVTQATALLREQGAATFQVDVHPDRKDGVRFWERQHGWVRDALTYRCYD